MTLQTVDNLAEAVNNELIEEVAAWLEKQDVNKEIQNDALEIGRIAARNILDPTQPGLKSFPRIPLDQGLYTDEGIRYMLIQEFLQSSGLHFTSSVLRFESQYPELEFQRDKLGHDLGFPSYDKTPYLVQIIEEILKKRSSEE